MKYFEDLVRKRVKIETNNILAAQLEKKPLFNLLSNNFLKMNREFHALWNSPTELHNLIFLERAIRLFDLEGPHIAYEHFTKEDIIRIINLCEEIPKEVIITEHVLFSSIYSFWCLLNIKVENAKTAQGRKNIKAFLNYNPTILQHFIKFGLQNVQVIDKVPVQVKEDTPEHLQKPSFTMDNENILNIIAPQFYTQHLFFDTLLKDEATHKRRLLSLQNARDRRQKNIEKLEGAAKFLDKNPHIEEEFIKYALGERGPFKFSIPNEFNKKLVLDALYVKVNRKRKQIEKLGKPIDLSKVPS